MRRSPKGDGSNLTRQLAFGALRLSAFEKYRLFPSKNVSDCGYGYH